MALRGRSGLQRTFSHVVQPVPSLAEQVYHSGSKRRRRRFSPQLESLETREVLSIALGMNLEAVSDYSGSWMFTDAFKASRPWIRSTNGSPDFGIPLDANGYPVRLTTGQQVETLMFDAIGNHYLSGPYT